MAPLRLYYDPNNNKWHNGAPLPRALTHIGLATLDDKLYAVGGFTGDVHKKTQADAFVYDPVKDRWSELPLLPQPRRSVATMSPNGKIHAIGGRDKGVWTSAAPCRSPAITFRQSLR